MDAMAEPQWMSIVEYARTFNVSDMTVRRRIKTGRLHAVLRDGKYYIPADGRSSPRVEADEPRPHPTKPISREHRPQPRYFDTHEPQPLTDRRGVSRHVHHRQDYQRPVELTDRNRVESEPRLQELYRVIDVCESAVKQFANLESKLEENYRSKVQLLEGKLLTKEREIEQLQQKIEDLQLLVSILEKRRS
jgi:predicted DNA-binding protein YlxM (UPF0122 family)